MYTYARQISPTHPVRETEANIALRMYRDMLRIRLVQERIASEYYKDEMKTPVHLYIGQEAIAVGVCSNLARTDLVFSNHRSHGHYLAKGGALNGLIAELYCRETGCSKGRGGSMHIADLSAGLVGSSSIVGGGIPLGTGAAFAAKMQNKKEISTIFFGDGAVDEGVLSESMNFAKLKGLPVMFVCENNFYAVCSPLHQRTAVAIWKRGEAFDIPSRLVDGTDVEAVHFAALEAAEHIRSGNGPYFMEIQAYRWRGHGGAKEDTSLGYRTAEELECWKRSCPLEIFGRRLEKRGILNDDLIGGMIAVIDAEIEEAFVFAQRSPLPKVEDLLNYVYKE